MYNVQFIEYPAGIQVKLYSNPVNYDFERKDVKKLEKYYQNVVDEYEQLSFDFDEFTPVDFSFDDIGIVEDFKSEESKRVAMTRAKNNIYYIARSNVWEWFVTLTLDKNKIDRYDYELLSRKVRKWFEHLRERKAPDIYYLIVPERHKDGAWHFHALIGGSTGLDFVESGHVDKSGNMIYNFENWKFGFSTATRVQDTARVSSYIAKYVTKTLIDETKGKHRFWASKNCLRAEVKRFLLEGSDRDEYLKVLYEHMTWKKRLEHEFNTVDIFELSKESGD